MKAKDIMTKNIVTMTPSTSALEAIGLLVDNKISGAPVLDENGKIVGVVTEKDLLVSLDFIGVKNAKDFRVEEFMTKEVITFDEDASVKEISQELVRKNIKRVPIVKDGKVLGIVSRHDILRHIGE